MSPEEIGTTGLVVPSRELLVPKGIVEFDFNGHTEKPVYITGENIEWTNLFGRTMGIYSKVCQEYGPFLFLDKKRAKKAEIMNALRAVGDRLGEEGFVSPKERPGYVLAKNLLISPSRRFVLFDEVPEDVRKSQEWTTAESYLRDNGYEIRGNYKNLQALMGAQKVPNLRDLSIN